MPTHKRYADHHFSDNGPPQKRQRQEDGDRNYNNGHRYPDPRPSNRPDNRAHSNPQKQQRPEDRPSSNEGLPQVLPPLPPIAREYEKAVFTHASIASLTDPYANYERLEFLGDAQLEHVASVIIFERYQSSTPGKMSSIREALVNNEALAKFTQAYGLEKKLRVSTGDYQPKEWTKIYGDLFEAYIAAVILSDVDTHYGFETVLRWMAQLWEPKLKQLGLKIMAPRDIMSKEQLARALLVKGAKIAYVEEKEPEVFKARGKQKYFMGAYFTGLGYENQYLGSGEGESKNEAGQNAAKNSLANPLIDNIKAKRAVFLEEKEKREKEEEEKDLAEDVKKKEEREKKNAELERKKEEKAKREQTRSTAATWA